jgi:hypothetical protein
MQCIICHFSARVSELEAKLHNTHQGSVGDEVFTVDLIHHVPLNDTGELIMAAATEVEETTYGALMLNVGVPVALMPQDTSGQNKQRTAASQEMTSAAATQDTLPDAADHDTKRYCFETKLLILSL